MHSSHLSKISTGFYNQKLGGLLLSKPQPWAGGPSVELGPLNPHVGPPPLRYPSQFLFAACGCGTSSFCISTASTCLHVASSLYPELQNFHSARFQEILNDGCSVGLGYFLKI